MKPLTPANRARLFKIAGWLRAAKASLYAVQGTYDALLKETADPRSPLHDLIDMNGGGFNVVDEGIANLDNIVLPGLAALPDPLGTSRKDGA